MKNHWKRFKGHFIGILFLVTLGVWLPGIIQTEYVQIIQIVLITASISAYLTIAYKKRASEKLEQIKQQQQSRMVESQRIMLELSNSMIQEKSFEELLNIILAKAIEMIPTASHGSILVMDKKGMLEFKAMIGFDEGLYKVKLEPEESYQWRATGGDFKGPIIIEDLLDYTHNFLSDDNYDAMNDMEALSLNSSLSAPIMINNRFFGSINVDSRVRHMFNDEDVQMMSYFANQATIAIVNHQLYDEMLYFSRYDSLTQIYNRRYFEEMLEAQLREKNLKCAIILIDLNRFKQINDLYGHRNGDLVLEGFASFFEGRLVDKDLVARYGGDEFVGVIYDKDYDQVEALMGDIHEENLSRGIDLIDNMTSIKCDFSYGIAQFPEDGKNLNELLHIADNRMYESKKVMKKRRREDQ